MDYEKAQYLANLVVTLLVTPLAMLLWSKLQKNETATDETAKDIAKLKLHAAETYATKHELAGSMERLERTSERIFAKLEKIDDKIDNKADK